MGVGGGGSALGLLSRLPLSFLLYPQVRGSQRTKVMGVLDIYGFEVFEVSAPLLCHELPVSCILCTSSPVT